MIAASLGATVVSAPLRGFGAACWAGLNAATTDVVCFMDCDGSLDPCHLERVATPVVAGDAELVLGVRRPSSRDAWPAHARVANRWLARSVSRRTGITVTDIGPMRAARREALLGLGMVDRRSGWPLEMVLRAAAVGWRIHEVDTPYRPRVGRSKVTGTVRGTLEAVVDMRGHLSRASPPERSRLRVRGGVAGAPEQDDGDE